MEANYVNPNLTDWEQSDLDLYCLQLGCMRESRREMPLLAGKDDISIIIGSYSDKTKNI